MSIVELVQSWERDRRRIPRNIDVVTGGFPCKDSVWRASERALPLKNPTFGDKSSEQISVANRGVLYLDGQGH